MYIYIYIYINKQQQYLNNNMRNTATSPAKPRSWGATNRTTPGLHNKIPAHNIFARVWVAQESIFFYTINAKTFQGLGPKRRESCTGDRV